MGDKSGIEWTEATWNPTTGCDRVSAGCDHCYALKMAARLKAMGSAHYQKDGDPRTSGPGFGLTVHEDHLYLPLRWTRPRRIFVNSMSDLFHNDVPDEFIARVFAVMAMADQHTFQVLTKRHGRMRSLLTSARFEELVASELRWCGEGYHSPWLDIDPARPAPNVWLGVSVEDQKTADVRIPPLLETPAAVRFLSCEPLLGPVSLTTLYPWGGGREGFRAALASWPDGVDWVIVGGESGPGARPMEMPWATDIVVACRDAGVPVFVKQMGSVLGKRLACADPKGHDIEAWPEHLRRREFPALAVTP